MAEQCRYEGCQSTDTVQGWCAKHTIGGRVTEARADAVSQQWDADIEGKIEDIIKGKIALPDSDKMKLLEKKLWQLSKSKSTKVSLDATNKLMALLKARKDLGHAEDGGEVSEDLPKLRSLEEIRKAGEA